MKRRLLFIFVFMSLCIVTIATLQYYFSYKNYTAADAAFKKDSNDALLEALDSTMAVHRISVGKQVGVWLADTTKIQITSKWNEEQKSSAFTLVELGTPLKESGSITLELAGLNKIRGTITPEIEKRFIKEIENMVASQLKTGGVIYFTQKLGKDIDRIYNVDVDTKIIQEQYRLALERRGITHPFTIANEEVNGEYCTQPVNFGVHKLRWLKACSVNTDAYLLGQLKWVIAGSLLLLLITLACFWYTARTLLSQQKLNKIKDDFISNMTHEIHTPLTSVLVTAEALKKFSHDEEARQNYLDIILLQSRKLSTLTHEILTSAKLDSQGMEMNDIIDIKNLLEEISQGFNKAIIRCTVPNEKVYLKGNRLHLGNAITNLVDNAFKYNTSDEPLVYLEAAVLNKGLIISVADNGPGIPDSDKEKVFGQFYRIPTGNVHDVRGYGLGLSYAKKVIAAHKGTITVEDNMPTGSIFKIILPYAA